MKLIGKDRPTGISTNLGHGSIGTAILSIAIALMLLAWLPPGAWAHAPKEVVPSYDEAKRVLSVRISHPSQSPNIHHISKVEIKKNGQTVSITEYKTQPQEDPFVYEYPLEVAPGDSVELKATCNIFGSKTLKLDIPKK